MSNDQLLANVAVSAATMLLLGKGFATMVKSSTDLLRENLFDRRRQLFRLVASGRIDPQCIQYVRIRSTINAMLRHAEAMSVWFLLFTYLATRKLPTASRSIKELLEELDDDEVADELDAALSGAVSDLLSHALRTSPVLWLACLIVGAAALVAAPIVEMAKWLTSLRGPHSKDTIRSLRRPLLVRITKVSERFSEDDEFDLSAA